MTDEPEWDKNIMFIPPYISCPKCEFKYNPLNLLERLIIPSSVIKCINCDYFFTKEYVGKFFGVLKDVG